MGDEVVSLAPLMTLVWVGLALLVLGVISVMVPMLHPMPELILFGSILICIGVGASIIILIGLVRG